MLLIKPMGVGEAMKYLICYDVPDDKCRRKIVKYLESIALRVQYSVFLAEFPARKIDNVQKQLWELAAVGEDTCIVIAPLCQNCEGKLLQYGKRKEKAFDYIID